MKNWGLSRYVRSKEEEQGSIPFGVARKDESEKKCSVKTQINENTSKNSEIILIYEVETKTTGVHSQERK